MSYEGYEQSLCKNGHYYEVDAGRLMAGFATEEEYRKEMACPDCGSDQAWRNPVDDTNCDAVGIIPQSELDEWLLDKSAETYRIPDEDETRAARHYWDGKQHIPLLVAEVMMR